MKNIFLLIIFILSNICVAQSYYTKVSEKDFYKYEVDKSTYQYWGILKENTTIPKFVKETHPKEYSIEINGNDTIATQTNYKRYNLEIVIKQLLLDKNLKKLKMKGQVLGAWSNVTPEEFDIFIGIRKDTLIEYFIHSIPPSPIIVEGKIMDSISIGTKKLFIYKMLNNTSLIDRIDIVYLKVLMRSCLILMKSLIKKAFWFLHYHMNIF